jgi:hypothetical protein
MQEDEDAPRWRRMRPQSAATFALMQLAMEQFATREPI